MGGHQERYITLDGVIDAPTWTFDYPLDPKMGEAIGGLMESSGAILLGAAHVRGVRAGVVRPDRPRRTLAPRS